MARCSCFIWNLALLLALTPCALAVENGSSDEGRSMPQEGPIQQDSSKIVGSDACVKCHGQELAVWKATPHYRTFRELHRTDEAQAIAGRMGIRSIKRGELCVQCHYTQQDVGGRSKVVSGVSCESCHGAAADWLSIHADFGGPTAAKSDETMEHRQERIENSIHHGMRNPSNVYLMARSCFNCHTVPHEQLVNVGGHVAGSQAFEFVSWSQGMIRHNFIRGEGTNVATRASLMRVMYLVGLMTDLEFSLRATAQATEVQPFGMTSAKRVYRLRRQLAALQEQIQDPHIESALRVAYGVKLKSNNASELRAAAELVGKAAFRLAQNNDGSGLAAVDAHLPAESAYK
jgi:hypothetical protein